MHHSEAPYDPRANRNRRWIWPVRCGAALLVSIITVSLIAQNDPNATAVVTQQGPVGADTLSHDEWIMLVMSVVVVFEIIAGYEYIRTIPCKTLLISSFGAVALSTVCTVAESFVLPDFLNYAEHILFALATILLAVWCGWVFTFNQPRRH